MIARPDLVRRLLVIKLRAVGDVLLSTVVLRSLRAAYPGARMDFLTEPPSQAFLRLHPDVDEVVVFDRTRRGGVQLIRDIRRRRYDLVLDLFGNPRTAVVTRFSGARWRAGYRFGWRRFAYSHVVEPRGGIVHNTQFNLDCLEALGIPVGSRELVFPTAPEDEATMEDVLRRAGLGSRPIVALHAGGGWVTKRWPPGSFALLGDLLEEGRMVDVVLPWGPGEESLVRELKGRMRRPAFVPPATTLTQLGALFRRCAAVVSNDSGPLHIAAAVGTRVLGIYGPTNPRLQGPYGEGHGVVRREGLPCLGCNRTRCPIGLPCMRELEPHQVLEAFDRMGCVPGAGSAGRGGL
ncbi:MAG: glycosyltransferase family 9 protein [Bacteroidota bacterium]